MVFSLMTTSSIADSTSITRRFDDIERTVKQIDANQLNYRIEKDLLKETYSNNYEKISLFITLFLGVVGIFGYLGLRDITSIKKEYEKELSNLRQIQSQFNIKSQEFDVEKKKFDEELKSIIKENEEQSRKIKFIELKDKVRSLLNDNQLTPALEFANAALLITNNDVDLLNQKGRILCRLNQIKEAVNAYQIARKTNPTDSGTILNTAECLYFAKDTEGASKLISEHKGLFESTDNGMLLELFNIIELYFKSEKDPLIQLAESYVTFENLKLTGKRMSGWDLTEAIYFIHHQPDSELKTIIQNIIKYWNGQITGENLLTELKIELPENLVEKK
ncbi:type IV pilus biogenesis/stability protein PilW [Aquirufa ecclesiirivi]